MTTQRRSRTQHMNHSGDDEGGSVEWGTPGVLFEPWHAVYDFTLDVAANHGNAKCERYCTPEGTFGPDRCTCPQQAPKYTRMAPRTYVGDSIVDAWHDPKNAACSLNGLLVQTDAGARRLIDYRDGLNFPWDGERCFMNPPWGDAVVPFLRKTVHEFLRHGVLVAAVLPARTDSWFHDYVSPYARYNFRKGRVEFIDPDAEARAAAGLPKRNSPPVGILQAIYR